MFGADLLANILAGMFLFGLIFTIASLVLGFVHAGDIDLPFLGQAHAPDLGHAGHLGHGGHAVGHDQGGGADGPGIFNLPTIMAFITWLGGVGYLLRGQMGYGPLLVLPLALISGLLGGAIMFAVLAKVLWPMMTKPLSTADYNLPGTLGTVVSPIREGGVGEIVYTKAGSRFTAGARAADGQPIGKGAEVVIMGYERGLALVRGVDDLLNEQEKE